MSTTTRSRTGRSPSRSASRSRTERFFARRALKLPAAYAYQPDCGTVRLLRAGACIRRAASPAGADVLAVERRVIGARSRGLGSIDAAGLLRAAHPRARHGGVTRLG